MRIYPIDKEAEVVFNGMTLTVTASGLEVLEDTGRWLVGKYPGLVTVVAPKVEAAVAPKKGK